MTDSSINQSKIAEELPEHSETVNLDWEVYDDTFHIYNFEVPEELQGEGIIGPKVLSGIKEICVTFEISNIEAHIDLTHRKSDGTYPSDKLVQNDPTLKFLRDYGFVILNYSRSETVYAKWTN